MGMWVGVGEPQKLRGAAILGRAEGSSLVSFKHQHPGKFQQYHRPRKGSLNPQDVPRKNLDGLQKRVFEDPSQRNRRRASTPSLGIYLPIFLQVRMSGRACMHLYMRASVLCQCNSSAHIWEFPKIRGYLIWGPDNEDPTIDVYYTRVSYFRKLPYRDTKKRARERRDGEEREETTGSGFRLPLAQGVGESHRMLVAIR